MVGTCIKCGGTGHIDGFRHIMNGDCFACGATGVAKIVNRADTSGTADNTGKTIQTEIGKLWITRMATRNGFTARASAPDPFNDGRMDCYGIIWFDVVDGKIRNVELSAGFSRPVFDMGMITKSDVRAILQTACTA